MQENHTYIFKNLFNSYFNQLYVHAFRWVNDEECAKDIVHDSYCYLREHLPQYDKDANFLALLYTFVRSRAADHLRKIQVREKYISYQQTFMDEDDSSEYFEYNERLEKVQRLIEDLPPQTKLAFVESVINQKSYKEVAELLNISPLTVNTHVARAYKAIRKKIIIFILCTPF